MKNEQKHLIIISLCIFIICHYSFHTVHLEDYSDEIDLYCVEVAAVVWSYYTSWCLTQFLYFICVYSCDGIGTGLHNTLAINFEK